MASHERRFVFGFVPLRRIGAWNFTGSRAPLARASVGPTLTKTRPVLSTPGALLARSVRESYGVKAAHVARLSALIAALSPARSEKYNAPALSVPGACPLMS